MQALPINEDISLYEGDTVNLIFTSKFSDLSGRILFQVRESPESRHPVIELEGHIITSTQYSIAIKPQDTLGKADNRDLLHYDIAVIDGDTIRTDREGRMTLVQRTSEVDNPASPLPTGKGGTKPLTILSDTNTFPDVSEIKFENLNVGYDAHNNYHYVHSDPAVLPPSTTRTDEVYSFNPVTRRLLPTGVTAKDGSIGVTSGSINIGTNTIFTTGAFLGIGDFAKQKQLIVGQKISNEKTEDATILRYTTDEEVWDGTNAATQQIVNPGWKVISDGTRQAITTIKLNFAKPQTNVYVDLILDSGEEVYLGALGDVSAGDNWYKLETPFIITNQLLIGKNRVFSKDGDVVLLGENDIPSLQFKRRFYDLDILATQNYVKDHSGTDAKVTKGDKGDRGPQGIQGPKGDKGEKGDKGDSGSGSALQLSDQMHSYPDITTISTDNTLSIESISDNEVRLAVDFTTIPVAKGEKGDTGSAGKDGRDGVAGRDGRDGVASALTVASVDGEPIKATNLVFGGDIQVEKNSTLKDTAIVTVKEHTFESKNAPHFLAYLDKNQVVKPETYTPLWFNDIVSDGKQYIKPSKAENNYFVEPWDGTDLKTSESTPYLVAFYVAFKGNAPADGDIIVSMDKGYEALQEPSGQIMVETKQVKAGDKLDRMLVAGIVNFKGDEAMSFQVYHTMKGDLTLLNRAEGSTGMLIQALQDKEKTSTAMLQFSIDTGQTFKFNSKEYGNQLYTLESTLTNLKDAAIIADPIIKSPMLDKEVMFFGSNTVTMAVSPTQLRISSKGIGTFAFGYVLNAKDTDKLRGHQLNLSFALEAPFTDYGVIAVRWEGKPDEYTTDFSDPTKKGMVFAKDWVEAPPPFLIEKNGSNRLVDHIISMPTDERYTNFAIVIVPKNPTKDLSLELNKFDINVAFPFTGYELHDPFWHSDLHKRYSYHHKTFSMGAGYYYELRFTINDKPCPMPVGIPEGAGIADVVYDPTLNPVPGSAPPFDVGEGGWRMNFSGIVNIKSTYQLYAGEALQKGQKCEVTFTIENKTHSVIKTSTFTVVGKDPKEKPTPITAVFNSKFDVMLGDELIMWATAIPEGATTDNAHRNAYIMGIYDVNKFVRNEFTVLSYN